MMKKETANKPSLQSQAYTINAKYLW